MIGPESLHDLEAGAQVLVRDKMDPKAPPRLGTVIRVATSYLWCSVRGLRDNLRVARSSGRGTIHSVTYQVTKADPETLESLRRQEVAQSLRAAVYGLDLVCRQRGTDAALERASIDEMQELDQRLRRLFEGPAQ